MRVDVRSEARLIVLSVHPLAARVDFGSERARPSAWYEYRLSSQRISEHH